MSEMDAVGVRGGLREKWENRVGMYDRLRGLECVEMTCIGQERVEICHNHPFASQYS